jgi:hypothetical protein
MECAMTFPGDDLILDRESRMMHVLWERPVSAQKFLAVGIAPLLMCRDFQVRSRQSSSCSVRSSSPPSPHHQAMMGFFVSLGS